MIVEEEGEPPPAQDPHFLFDGGLRTFFRVSGTSYVTSGAMIQSVSDPSACRSSCSGASTSIIRSESLTTAAGFTREGPDLQIRPRTPTSWPIVARVSRYRPRGRRHDLP